MNELANNRLVQFIEDIILFIDYILVPLVFALALIAFLWGIFNFFIAGGADEEKREKGKQFMVWGFIGFFVMVSVWGIVNLLVGTFGFDRETRPDLPSFNGALQGSTNQNQNGDCPPGEVPYASGCIPLPNEDTGCPAGEVPYAGGCIPG